MSFEDLSEAAKENTKNLIPFKEGHDPRRARGKGRPSIIDTPEKVELFAQMLADGLNADQIAEGFKCCRRTVLEHKKDPRVKAAAAKYIEDRVLRIVRRTDSIIEARLQKADEMNTETLLKLRKEFLGGTFRLQTTGDAKDDRTINDTMAELEANPALEAELTKVLSTSDDGA